MSAIASQITSLTIVYSTVYSAADQRKHQSSASLAFVRGNHRGPVNSPHKWPVTRSFDVSVWWRHHVIIKRVIYWIYWIGASSQSPSCLIARVDNKAPWGPFHSWVFHHNLNSCCSQPNYSNVICPKFYTWHSCLIMCKHLYQSNGEELTYNKTNFQQGWNCDGKLFRDMGPIYWYRHP